VTYRVIQWATGGVGTETLRILLDRDDVELVGVFAHSPAKVGRDAGELAGRDPIGVTATGDRNEILALDADVVVHTALLTPEGWPQMDDDVVALLRSGKNVVSSASYFWPTAHGADYHDQFDRAAGAGGVTLYGTGMNPGLILDRLPVTLTTLCTNVDHLRLAEIYDVSQHPSPAMLFGQMGMGQDRDQFTADAPIGVMFRRMYGEVVTQVANMLGAEVERVDARLNLGLATRDLELPAGLVRKGTIAGTNWVFSAIVDGRPYVELEQNWIVDKDLPDWDTRRVWIAEIEGSPSMRLELKMVRTWGDRSLVPWYDAALHCTAAAVVHAIPEVIAAEPGVLRQPTFAPYRYGEDAGAYRPAATV